MRILTTYFNTWLQCKYIWSTLNFNHFGAFEEKGPLNLIYNFFIGFSSYGILSQRVKKQIKMLLMYLLFVLKGMRSKYIGHIICYTMVLVTTSSPPPLAIFLIFQVFQWYMIGDVVFWWKVDSNFGHFAATLQV